MRQLRTFGAVLAVGALALAAPAPTLAALDRVETAIPSAAPQDDVVSSLVKLRAPLPEGVPEHPAACDWIQFQRFRHRTGPADPTSADAVSVLMPGNLEGATAFDPLARNAIREAARRGKSLEVWATDRRANCLEDPTGLDLLEATGDLDAATDYYWRGAAINGQRFAGWRRDPKILAELGVEQTVRDFHTVLTRELPDQAWREQHVTCGGHSLAGGLLEIFAGWDFDGDPASTADAGYRQCAGFIGFETLLDIGLTSNDPPKVRALAPLLPAARQLLGAPTVRALRAGTISRHEALLGIGPETMALMEAVAIMAARDPNAEATDWLRSIPVSSAVRGYYRVTGSPTLGDYLAGNRRLTDLRFTYAGLLGQMFDDNASALSVIRASFGYPVGAPLIRNRLPEQVFGLPGLDLLFQRGRVVIPRRTRPQPLSGWANYDALQGSGPGAAPIGAGVTSPASEVTDAREFARIMFEGPTNLVESWFPTRIVTDLAAVATGDRSGAFKAIVHPHPTRRKPRFVVLGGDGVLRKSGIGALDPHIVLPGYEHLDVLTAAERQHDGQPERSSQTLVDFTLQATTPR
ncbi:MAG: hypothetical protein JHD16_06425 [Solirubrobacteraceae bacterium]|nr:hypothetical protein [Solirubrobacteraceae bacterium]